MPRIELGSGPVRRTRPPALGLAAGPSPFAAALLEQHQLRWLRAPRTAATGSWLAELHATWIAPEVNSVNRLRRDFRRRQSPSFPESSTRWKQPPFSLSEFPKHHKGGLGPGRWAVSGASGSTWSSSTRRSQAALRSPDVCGVSVVRRTCPRSGTSGVGRAASRASEVEYDLAWRSAGTPCRRPSQGRAATEHSAGEVGPMRDPTRPPRQVSASARAPCATAGPTRGLPREPSLRSHL